MEAILADGMTCGRYKDIADTSNDGAQASAAGLKVLPVGTAVAEMIDVRFYRDRKHKSEE